MSCEGKSWVASLSWSLRVHLICWNFTVIFVISQIYDSPESDLKLNDVFEFIGVFTFDPEFPVDKNDNNDLESILDDDTRIQMPPSKVFSFNVFICWGLL